MLRKIAEFLMYITEEKTKYQFLWGADEIKFFSDLLSQPQPTQLLVINYLADALPKKSLLAKSIDNLIVSKIKGAEQ